MTKFREIILTSGTKIFLGKDSKSNDELMKKFSGKKNLVIHTIASGSPFCVIDSLNPKKQEIREAAIICASKSQDWRDNQKSVKLHIFKAKDAHKPKNIKQGTWTIGRRPKTIKARRREIKNAN